MVIVRGQQSPVQADGRKKTMYCTAWTLLLARTRWQESNRTCCSLPTYLSLKDSSCSNNLTDFCIHIHIHTDRVHKSTLNPVHAIIKAFRPLHKPSAASPLPFPTPTTAQVRLTHFSPREILSVVLPKLSFIYSNCEYSLWPVPPYLIFAYDPA
jgi:hypothetical protein